MFRTGLNGSKTILLTVCIIIRKMYFLQFLEKNLNSLFTKYMLQIASWFKDPVKKTNEKLKTLNSSPMNACLGIN